MLNEINDCNFNDSITDTKPDSVLVFSSQWCGVCRMVLPRLESISEKYPDIMFCKVDATINRTKPAELGVLSIPTILFLKNGKETARLMGDVSEERIEEKVKELL